MSSSSRSKFMWPLLVILLLVVIGGAKWGMASLWESKVKNATESTPPAQTPMDSESDEEYGMTADGLNDFGSCSEDIANYCSGFKTEDWVSWAEENGYVTASWKLGLVDCLEQNRDFTSQTCDDSLDRRQVLNEDVNTLCADDRNTYCKGVTPKPGEEPQVDCLMEHYDEVSLSCQEALTAHEDAKRLEE